MTAAHVYMWHHQDAKFKHFDVSNVIYHKFSHGPVSYTLNGENIIVMLEYDYFQKKKKKKTEKRGIYKNRSIYYD